MKRRPIPTLPLASAAFMASLSAASAHHAEFMADKPFVQGLSMPAHGLDHLLSALSVGLLASQAATKSRFKLPAIFATLTLIGGFLNIAGVSLPELSVPLATAIAAILLWSGSGAKVASAAAWIAIMGATNGQALLQSPPQGAGAALFALGCLCSTVAACGAGCLLGHSLQLSCRPNTGRFTAAALLGILSLASVFPEVNEALLRLIESTR